MNKFEPNIQSMKKFPGLIIVLLHTPFMFCQSLLIDEKFDQANQLMSTNADSALSIITGLQQEIENYSNLDQARFFQKSISFYQRIGDYQAEFQALQNLENYLPPNSDTLFRVRYLEGMALMNSGNFDKSMKLFQACEIYSKQHHNERQLASAYSGQANIYTATGKIPEAIEYYNKAINLAQKEGNSVNLSKLYSNLSIAYSIIGDNQRTLELRLKGYQIAKAVNDTLEIHFGEINLGGTYNVLEKPDSAIYYLSKALTYFEENFNAQYLNALYNELGRSYTFLEKYDTAEVYYLKSIDLLRSGGFDFALPGTLGNYGLVLYLKGDYRKGIEVCREALPIAVRIQYSQVERVVCDCLYKNFKSANIPDSALVYLERTMHLNEQLEGVELQKSALRKDLENKHENEKSDLVKSNKEKLAKASYLRNLLIIGISLLLVSLLVLFWAFRQKRKSVRFIDEERQYLDNLLHNIVHEFRTPLTLIKGPSEELLLRDQQNVFALAIHKNSEHMLELVNQVLDFAKLKAGKLPLMNEVTDLNVFFSDCIALFDSAAKQKKIELILSTLPVNAIVSIDSSKLFKIVSNLISNAVKYCESGDTVTLRYSIGRNKLTILVEDTGPGIAKEDSQRIFEKFYQVDSSSTRKAEGTGLGLAFVKELVSLLEGTISLESEPGKGTKFLVILPFGVAETELSVSRATKRVSDIYEADITSKEETGDEKLRILVVEDNTDLQKYLQTILVQQGYEVLLANNGEDGILIAVDQIPDLIISDVMMPKVDGFQFVTLLKTNPTTNHIHVILLTAKASFDSRIKGLESGADDYLTKPFSSSELFLRINNALLHQQKIQEKNLSSLVTKKEEEQIHPLIQKIKDITMGEDGNQINVENLANLCALSRSQLHRKVVQLTGISTNALQTKIRLEGAKTDLKNTELTIAEVAYKYGYSDPSNFTRLFRKQFNISPTEFRNS